MGNDSNMGYSVFSVIVVPPPSYLAPSESISVIVVKPTLGHGAQHLSPQSQSAESGVSGVIFTFCDTAIPQSMKIIWEIPLLRAWQKTHHSLKGQSAINTKISVQSNL